MAEQPEPSPKAPAPRSSIAWPPPGLERMQADLWGVASRGALAGGILVLPLVFVISGRPGLATLGPFADAWWVTLVLAAVGLGFAIDCYASLGRMLRRVSHALQAGHDWRSVAFTLADLHRDMGFLMQGGRHFSVLDKRERTALAGLRVMEVTLFALAGAWLPIALAVMLLVAARGWASPTAVWVATLLPATLCYMVGGVATTAEQSRVRRARAKWFQKPWASDLVADEIARWREVAASHEEATGLGSPSPRRATLLRRLALASGALTVVVAVPVLTLVPASALGPTLVSIAVPNFEEVQRRAASVEALRDYRVPTDPGLDPLEAGRLLHSLMYVGSDRTPPPGELAPEWHVAEPWIPAIQQGSPLALEPHRWAGELFQRVRSGLDVEGRTYLAELAGHPGTDVYSRLAQADRIDIAGGRWTSPFPASVSIVSVPTPSVGGIRGGSYAHIGGAAYHLANGRQDQAERMIRETISVGFLLGDQGPTLLDNLAGYVIAEAGGTALEGLYEATGRQAEASELRRLMAAAERSARRIQAPPLAGIEALVRSMPSMVSDTTAVRGLRWEYLVLTTTLTPCLNLSRMVFGPDEAYERFLDEAEDVLVEWPSEEDLFRLARLGYWGASREESWLGRVLGVAMRSGRGSCGDVVRRLRALEEVL